MHFLPHSLRRALLWAASLALALTASAQRQMENLGRGVVAIRQDATKIFVSWRLLGTDPDTLAFNLYRATDNGAPREAQRPAARRRHQLRRRQR